MTDSQLATLRQTMDAPGAILYALEQMQKSALKELGRTLDSGSPNYRLAVRAHTLRDVLQVVRALIKGD